jgi:hypothetical protein
MQSSYNSVTGCTFEGTNTSLPPGFDPAQEFNIGIEVWAPGGHNMITRNTFRHFWGNAAVSIYGSGGNSSDHNVVSLNTFENNGIYGAVIVDGRYNLMSYNQFINCSVGLEPDDTGQSNTGNIVEHNVIKNDGKGRPDGVYLRLGGYPAGFNYNGNQANFNQVEGPGSVTWLDAGVTPSVRQTQVNANQCTNGCTRR